MSVEKIMSTNVRTITDDVSAEEAWHRMNLYQIHHFVVVRGHEIVGILSERDLGGKYGNSVCEGPVVAELMSSPVISTQVSTTVKEAANMLRGYSVGCMPVFDDEKLVGIVTISDLLELIGGGISDVNQLNSEKTDEVLH